MAIAAITYADLQQSSPAVITKVMGLLKRHPHYQRWMTSINLLPLEEQEMAVFMRAARWPDEIRGRPEFDRPEHHYINMPLKPEGQTDTVKNKEPLKQNIAAAFEQNFKVLKDARLSDEQRAIAICWLFHLAGDVHQPLHTSTFFTTDFPQGDRGGTRFYVR